MLTVFIRTILLYLLSTLAVRLMGKRQIGQLQPYEFVLALMIAELAAAPMEGVGTPLLYGIIPILGLLVLHGLGTLLSMKSVKARKLLSGSPSVIIRNGVIQYAEMKRMCYTVSDLLEEIRGQGYLNIADVGTAIMETSGKLSVFSRGNKRPVSMEDMHLPASYEGIPMTLAVDGKIQREHLKKCGLDENWLLKQLGKLGYHGIEEVLLASLDTKGKMYVQGKEENVHLIQALDEKQVVW